jgi:hypothetical protein
MAFPRTARSYSRLRKDLRLPFALHRAEMAHRSADESAAATSGSKGPGQSSSYLRNR